MYDRLGDSYFVSFYYSLSSRLNKQSDLEKVCNIIGWFIFDESLLYTANWERDLQVFE